MRRAVALAAAVVLVGVGLPTAASAASAVRAPAGTESTSTESTKIVQGELQRLAVELPGGGGIDLAVVVPAGGGAVRVQAEDVAGIETGATVAAEVVPDSVAAQDVGAEDGGVAVTELEVLAAAPEGESTSDLAAAGLAALDAGSRQVGVVTGTFTGIAAPSRSATQFAGDITSNVSPYWSDSTGGAITFQVAKATGPIPLGAPPARCTVDEILAVLDASAEALGMYPAVRTGRHTVLHTNKVAACGFAGIGHVDDGGSVWINGAGTRWSTVAHELGHTLTLNHSNTRVQCSGGQDGPASQCRLGEYGDAYDVMGSAGPANAAGPLSGAQLDVLGLAPAGSMLRLTESARVTLRPVAGLTGRRFVNFTIGAVEYYVEYRAAVGRDADLGVGRYGCPLGVTSSCSTVTYQPGVLVRRVEPGDDEPTSLLDADMTSGWFAMDPGESFTTRDMSVRVRVVSADATAAVLDVTFVDTRPQTPFAQLVASPDVTGNRLGDLFAVDASGRLFLYGGVGGGRISLSRVYGTGWDEMRVFAPGDWNGDGRSDLVAADAKGDLWLYPGNGAGGFGAKSKIGNGWNGYRIVPAGDMNGDRKADLLAIDPQHRLWLYPGNGAGSFTRRIQVGNGWNGFDLFAAGDANRDGRNDILSIDRNGNLWYYAGRGGGYFAMRRQVGNGWNGFAFASGADINGDGYGDLVGRDPSGVLWFYAGRYGGSFAMRVQIGRGF